DALLLASSAIPQSYLRAIGDQLIWASGVKSWFEFAAQGIWVCGCDDNLGAGRARQIEHLWGGDINWLTLTHRDSPSFPSVATYVLKAKSTDFSPGSKKYFYWRSGSLFKRALELFPEIVNGVHSCGMGQTFDIIHEILGKNTPLYVFVNENQWKEMFKGMGAK
ncbi:MAG: hypothetical protein L3J13_10805, partial [Devosiaceae bacterium]|nr:hypothetical protein [Devosiaceae bacterium]